MTCFEGVSRICKSFSPMPQHPTLRLSWGGVPESSTLEQVGRSAHLWVPPHPTEETGNEAPEC